jgi:steroid 5-alpha reductase family enzyme
MKMRDINMAQTGRNRTRSRRRSAPRRNGLKFNPYLVKIAPGTTRGEAYGSVMTLALLILSIAVIAVAMSVIMSGAWLIREWTGNSGWVDAVWTAGLGIVGIGASLLLPPQHFPPREMIVAILIAFWAARLGVHVAARTTQIADDPRYAKLAKDWGEAAPRRMFVFLQQQALGSVPLALSVYLAAKNPAPMMRTQDYIGIVIVLVAVVGEAIADGQLRRFKADPANRGKVMDRGLWAWSRHPNYFFQWFGWLAWPVIAIDLSGGYLYGWLALMGAAIMYWLLRYVSGVPHLEAHMERSRGAAFRDYQRRTSVFFPAPPKS